MRKPTFEPHNDGTFRVEHDMIYRSGDALLRRIRGGEITGEDATSRLRELLLKYPYHFDAVVSLCDYYSSVGDFDKCCDLRYKAAQRIIDLLPEDDDDNFALDWEFKDNLPIGEILISSAIDHSVICDFEMAAGMLETLLDLDGDDHFGATKPLAYCYIALDEREMFDAILFDIDDKDVEKTLLRLWASVMFTNEIDKELLEEFKTRYKSYYEEFLKDDHDYLDTPESGLWWRTDHLWREYPRLIELMKIV